MTALAESIAELCVRIPVAAGPNGMAKALAGAAPDFSFREVLARGGWYRLGGVVDGNGRHISNDIEQWIQAELAAHGDDLQELVEAHADEDLRPTRLTGKTHYWTASSGNAAGDFIQVEIEELQEVMCQPMFTGDESPATVEELVDARHACHEKPAPLGMPFYRLRRVTEVAEFLARMRAQKPEAQPVHRFLQGWAESSAGHATRFANHWVLALREHLDRYHQTVLEARPVPAINGAPPRFDGAFGVRGLGLAGALQGFDRHAGYPMAWFFHMLTTKAVPHAVAGVVVEDMQSGFAYLPERDVQVVKDWLFKPYGF